VTQFDESVITDDLEMTKMFSHPMIKVGEDL
jgi:hypothetical protein